MAKLGVFTKVGDEFSGEVITLSVQARGVRMVPTQTEIGESHRYSILIGQAEVGVAWAEQASDNDDLQVYIDDPTFSEPIRAVLAPSCNGTFILTWVRPSGKH